MADTRTPDEIERDIERERAALGETVDELQDRFSPDRIVRELSTGLTEHGQEIGEAITRSVKRNPVALALTGIGLAWLMSGRSWEEDKRAAQSVLPNGNGRRSETLYDRSAASDRAAPASTVSTSRAPAEPRPTTGSGLYARDGAGSMSTQSDVDDWLYADDDTYWLDDDDDDFGDYGDDNGPSVGDRLSNAGSRVASSASGAAQSVGDGARSVKDGVADTAARGRDAAARGVRSARDGVVSARDSAAARAGRIRRRLARGTEDLSEAARERIIAARWSAVKARRAAARRARQGSDAAQAFYNENPLVVGGLAIAAGAVLAGALPRTRQEDELVGQQSDRYYDKAQRILESERQKAQRVAERAAETAKDVLEKERAKVDDQAPGSKSAAEHVADEVKRGVSEVADATRDEAQKQKLGSAS